MNKTVETLFDHFLNIHQTGELWEKLRIVSAAVDAAMETGDMDKAIELTADHELAAMRVAFYAGFQAALGLGSCGLAA